MRTSISSKVTRVAAIAVTVSLITFAASTLIGPAVASSSQPGVSYDIAGVVTDPGPTTSDIVPAGSRYRFNLTGGSHWAGGLEGDTTYTGPGMFDPTTGRSDSFVTEVFTGSLPGVGSGRLECNDHLVANADGSGTVDLWVVRGTGKLSGFHGHLHFSWSSTNLDGSVTGEFEGVLFRA